MTQERHEVEEEGRPNALPGPSCAPAPETIEQAHAVVLAGGTMQPFSDLKQQLFARLPKEKLRIFSHGHIVPAANLLPLVVSTTQTGETLPCSSAVVRVGGLRCGGNFCRCPSLLSVGIAPPPPPPPRPPP